MTTIEIPKNTPPKINEHGSEVYRRFRSNSDRYEYDFELCASGHGWIQLNTSQDASYYGIWINLETRMVVSFCEGDETITVAPTRDAMRAELAALEEFHGDAPPSLLGIGEDGSICFYYFPRPGPDDVKDEAEP